MNIKVLQTNQQPNKKLIKAIESVKGWFIDWQDGCIKLHADTKERLSELITFVELFIETK